MPPADQPSSFALPITGLDQIGDSPLYLTGEDALLLTVFNGAAGVVVTVSGRTLAFGERHPKTFKRTLTPTTNRAASTLLIPLGDGWLLNAQAIVTSGAPLDGQTFARLSLVRGLNSAIADEFYTLTSDSITTGKAIAFPDGANEGALDGAGALRSITGATPGAGAEISETVPTGARWDLLCFRAQLATSATVANRVPQLILDDGANEYTRSAIDFAVAASQTDTCNWAQGYPRPAAFVAPAIDAPIPTGIRLTAGHRIRTLTVAIQAGDQYSAVQYLVREWIEA